MDYKIPIEELPYDIVRYADGKYKRHDWQGGSHRVALCTCGRWLKWDTIHDSSAWDKHRETKVHQKRIRQYMGSYS